MGTLLAKYTD